MITWTVAHQAPLSIEFSRQEYWSGLPCPSPGDLPDPGMEPGSPTLQDSLLNQLFSCPGRDPMGAAEARRRQQQPQPWHILGSRASGDLMTSKASCRSGSQPLLRGRGGREGMSTPFPSPPHLQTVPLFTSLVPRPF